MRIPDQANYDAEQGLPLPDPTPIDDTNLPPKGGKYPIPHYSSFSAIVNSLSRTYRWTFDEALRDSQQNSLAIRRDPVIMEALRARQMPTAQLQWHLEPEDATDMRQVAAVKELTTDLERIPNWQRLVMHLLEAVFYGRYGVQIVYGWTFRHGKRRLTVRDFRPVNGDKLVFRFSGQVGVLVHSLTEPYGVDTDITDRGRAHFLSPDEREQLVVHSHEPEDADFYEGELAGAVFGVGVRSRLYWFWWLRAQVLGWLMDYIQRVGAGGFTIYYYEAGNPESEAEVRAAATEQFANNIILFPRYRDGKTGGPGVERVDPNPAGASLLQALVMEYFDEVLRRFILGQTLSSQAEGTGLGSGVAELHADTFARIIKYDAINLAETLTRDLVRVLARHNHPGVPAPVLKFDVDKPNAAEVLEAAKTIWEMGGEIDGDEIKDIAGLSKPAPGHAVLTNLPTTSPAGVGALPQGQPIVGQPGPASPQQVPQSGTLFNARGEPVQFAGGPPPIHLSPEMEVQNLARAYMDRHQSHRTYDQSEIGLRRVPEEVGSAIADWYHAGTHSPDDKSVRDAYRAFKDETLAQFNFLRHNGVHFEPVTDDRKYYNGSKAMRSDAALNKHLYVNVGSGDFSRDNLLSQPTGISLNGHNWTYNDMFRAVHDYFGHAQYGNEFGPNGEDMAYRVHSRMYSPQARPAMATETRGQNSWVNFGPHLRKLGGGLRQKGEPGYIPPSQRPFADQKNMIMPSELMEI